MSLQRAWDTDSPGPSHRWECDDEEYLAQLSDDEVDPMIAAAKEFEDGLLELYMLSQISAQHFCTLCFWAHKAGMNGNVASYGLKPGCNSGAYQRHLDRVLGIHATKQKVYTVKTVGQPRNDVARGPIEVAMLPIHEVVDEELTATRSAAVQFQEAVDERRFPPAYWSNPVVKASPTPVVPLALFLDGVPYSLTDSVVGVWVVNLLTSKRHLLGVVRKAITCKCGCRGWDTWYSILRFLRWSLRACAQGSYPSSGHDGELLSGRRAALAGAPMKYKAVVVHIRGDWAEFCERFGFPTCASNARPCFLCDANQENMHNSIGLSLASSPWHLNTDEDFEAACNRCEIHVQIDSDLHKRIRRALQYDKRPMGGKGRCLTESFPEVGLIKGDRLEATEDLPDVAEFDHATLFPFSATFWRPSLESSVYHRCVLWDSSIGLTACATIAIDLLHTYYLGPMHEWSKMVVWRFLKSGLWGASADTADERKIVSVSVMKNELFRWYSEKQRQGESFTRVSDLTPKMVGTLGKPRLKTKAMETYGICCFLVESLAKYKEFFGNDFGILHESGTLLVDSLALLKRCSSIIPLPVQQQLLDSWKRFVRLASDLDINTPKSHMDFHMFKRMDWHGNPFTYHTFEDESMNKVLKKVLRNCHQCTLETMCLSKMAEAMDLSAKRRRA